MHRSCHSRSLGTRRRYLPDACVAALAVLAFAAAPAPASAAAPVAAPAAAREWRSHHVATIGGRRIAYTATAEIVPVTSDAAKGVDATFGLTSYVVTGRRGAAPRPVVFAFNGGPGSSSIWLHMKLLGPREVLMGDDVAPRGVPPFALADNPDSPLDVADIVLIDPPGTGFARLMRGTDAARYHGVQADAVATVGVIERWLTRHGRWNAPRYLLGESYGATRAAVVADLLSGGGATGQMDGVALNGVIVMGQALDLAAAPHGDRAYLTGLPAQAAVAWYHRRASTDLPSAAAAQAAATAFVQDGYVSALFAGDRLSPAARRVVAARLSSLTGLSVETIERHDLRVPSSAFARDLLADRHLALGLYDGRMTLRGEGDPENLSDDPTMGRIAPAFVAALNDYLRRDLGVVTDTRYVSIDFASVNARWDYGNGSGVPPTRDFASHLSAALRRNPAMRLLVVSGRYELVTPAAEAHYVVAHAGLPSDRTIVLDVDSGHMPYLGSARAQLAGAIRRFVAAP